MNASDTNLTHDYDRAKADELAALARDYAELTGRPEAAEQVLRAAIERLRAVGGSNDTPAA